MAAMKPRTGDGPIEVTKEGRIIVMRIPAEGGGRLVIELNAAEVSDLREALEGVVAFLK
jgi:tRNA threonylcarbamoyladenosine modification (KEOPS) complex  Pcc1 subunit